MVLVWDVDVVLKGRVDTNQPEAYSGAEWFGILKGRVEGGFGGEWEACAGRADCVQEKSRSFFKECGMVRWLWVLGVMAASAFVVGVALEMYWLRLLTKPIPVGCMAAWLWFREEEKGWYEWGILLGLLCSIGGDMFLELSAGMFVVGLGWFLTAHLFYVMAYTSATRRAVALQLLPFLGYGVALYAYMYGSIQQKFPRLVIPVALYTLVICCMMWRASAMLQEADIRRQAAWSALLGAMIFASSDSVIALNKFVWPIPGARYVIIVTYWLGQLGIVRSVMRAEATASEAEGAKSRTYVQRAG